MGLLGMDGETVRERMTALLDMDGRASRIAGMEWFLKALRDGLRFTGRSRRREYGWFQRIIVLPSLASP